MRKILLLAFIGCYFTSAAQQGIDVLHYRFAIELSDKHDTVDGVAVILLRYPEKNIPISFDLVNVGAKGKGMKVYEVRYSEEDKEVKKFIQKNDELILPYGFENSFDSIAITIKYRGVPADGLIISRNKYGDRTFFADNWPNRAHNWIPCMDRPDDKASFEFIVTAPSQYSVISNGIKITEKQEGNGMKRTHWKEDIPLSTKVMVIGVAKFAIKTFDDRAAGIPVSAWVYPQDSVKGFYDYALAPEIVKFMADYIGPFPYKKLANVQSKTVFGGMENASAIFYAENSVTGDRSEEDLLAHEIAHQWFGDMVSEKNFAHLWLSEGFATYFTNIYFENKYGKAAFQKRLVADREKIIEFVKRNKMPVVDSLSMLMELLNTNSYQKGAWVLRMLRTEVGDKTFQEIVREYYVRYKGGNADSRDFQAVAEKVSGKELGWFFDQWLYRPGIPALEINHKVQDNNFVVTVKQQQKQLYQFKLEVSVITKDGELIKREFKIQDKESEFKIECKGQPHRFMIDPDVKLLYELKE